MISLPDLGTKALFAGRLLPEDVYLGERETSGPSRAAEGLRKRLKFPVAGGEKEIFIFPLFPKPSVRKESSPGARLGSPTCAWILGVPRSFFGAEGPKAGAWRCHERCEIGAGGFRVRTVSQLPRARSVARARVPASGGTRTIARPRWVSAGDGNCARARQHWAPVNAGTCRRPESWWSLRAKRAEGSSRLSARDGQEQSAQE